MKVPNIKFFDGYPVVRSEKAKEIDRIAVMDYGIKEEVLMENAGRNAACEIERYILDGMKKELKDVCVSVLCGRGNNGGDGLVCARYLKEKGAEVLAFIVAPNEKGYGKLVVENLERAKKVMVSIVMVGFDNLYEVEEKVFKSDVVIDALLGIGTSGKPVGIVKRLIQIANKSGKDIISLDIPSGLLPDTGHHTGVFITAKMTLTFGFPKTGLMAAHAQKYIGKLKVIDIGYPPELYERIKKEVAS